MIYIKLNHKEENYSLKILFVSPTECVPMFYRQLDELLNAAFAVYCLLFDDGGDSDGHEMNSLQLKNHCID